MALLGRNSKEGNHWEALRSTRKHQEALGRGRKCLEALGKHLEALGSTEKLKIAR